MSDTFWAAVWWQLSFAVALALILGGIVVTNRVQGISLASMGWRKPAPKLAIFCGVLLGTLYVLGVYAGILNEPKMEHINPFAIHWVRFALIPIGVFMAIAEEIMMRGAFMTYLAQARVPTWAQIVLSGACSAVYHSFHNFTWIGFIPSFVLFSLHALLYVAGQRSLTPPIIAHSMYHVLCAPYLLMFAMVQSAA
jgi:membrane protease YdiL (CAAX protease family)